MKVRDWREDENSDVLTIVLDGSPDAASWELVRRPIIKTRGLHGWNPKLPATFAVMLRCERLDPMVPQDYAQLVYGVFLALDIDPRDIGTLTVEQGPATDDEWTQITIVPGEPMVWPE